MRGRRERIEQIERDRDTLLEGYARMAPEALDTLTTEERSQVYRMLRMEVLVRIDKTLEVSGTFGEEGVFCPTETPYSTP